MNAIISVACIALILLLARGTYSLQWWLERTDYERHFED